MKKQRKTKSVVLRKLGVPVFLYWSKCCNEKAEKPPLLKTEEHEGMLGSWRCSKCGKSCACARTLNKLQKAEVEEVINV